MSIHGPERRHPSKHRQFGPVSDFTSQIEFVALTATFGNSRASNLETVRSKTK
jgi:hypothetical protein